MSVNSFEARSRTRKLVVYLCMALLCRETVGMSDGGHVCLDWYNEGHPSQPTLIVLPGITGKGFQ